MKSFLRFSSLSLFLVLASALYSVAHEKAEMPDYTKPYTGSAEFEQLKSLSGTWSGTGMMHGQEKPVTVTYKTTSGGSVVLETLFPDTPHEMVSVYYEKDGQVVMTHFCTLKNQPELTLKNSSDQTLQFDFVDGSNMDSSKDMHMHSLAIKIEGPNKMVQEWTPYLKGRAGEDATTLTLVRAQ